MKKIFLPPHHNKHYFLHKEKKFIFVWCGGVLITLAVLFSFGTAPIGILSGSYGVNVFAQETLEPEQSTVQGEAELPVVSEAEVPVVSEAEVPVVSEAEVPVVSEVELPDPGITPDSPFYFLETIAEEIVTFFTFGDLKKAERYANLAAERIAEAKAISEKAKPKAELIEKTLKRYERQLNKSVERAEKAMFEGKDFEKIMEARAKAGKATSKHLEVLTEVYEKVPEQAKPAVENAMKASLKRHEKEVHALKSSNRLGEVPEEAPISTKVPQEARERIQRKMQEELKIEKEKEQIKQTIDKVLKSSESPRDFCLRAGASPEQCEKLPAEDFKSFKQIETYCVESGGPPEYCVSLKAKCKELGVTKAGDCFRVISNVTLTTFQSVELKRELLPALSEEEMKQMEQNRIKQQGGATIKLESGGKIIEKAVEAPKVLKPRYVPNASKVIIYSAPTCPHCAKAKNWFQGNNIKYEEFDISQDKIKQNELMKKTGRLVVPIIEVENDMIVGFNEEKFSELFGIE